MKIYRVENCDGIGPFHAEPPIFTGAELEAYNNWRWNYIDKRHPSPWFDDLDLYLHKDNMAFGCPGKKSLLHWFGPILGMMRELRLIVSVYESTIYHYGESGTQVVFDRKEARLVGRLSDEKLADMHSKWLKKVK